MSRIPQLEREALAQRQRAVYDAVLASRGSIEGPFRVWLHSPELADRAQHLGQFLRYRTTLEPRLSELAILVTAQSWNCQVEWALHETCARQAGLDDEIIAALRSGSTPVFTEPDEEATYTYCSQLLEGGTVADPAFAATVDQLGQQATVELTGVVGYYTFVALTLNAFAVPLPAGTAPPLSPR
ncbi:MAG: carboxymuconolactone decarboxylase family protein [Candidatus Latescibacteria bacterium]|nr:carboxymuconolactone decarboxylase family protein [Candidatus Latescibacterota bacterium]